MTVAERLQTVSILNAAMDYHRCGHNVVEANKMKANDLYYYHLPNSNLIKHEIFLRLPSLPFPHRLTYLGSLGMCSLRLVSRTATLNPMSLAGLWKRSVNSLKSTFPSWLASTHIMMYSISSLAKMLHGNSGLGAVSTEHSENMLIEW